MHTTTTLAKLRTINFSRLAAIIWYWKLNHDTEKQRFKRTNELHINQTTQTESATELHGAVTRYQLIVLRFKTERKPFNDARIRMQNANRNKKQQQNIITHFILPSDSKLKDVVCVCVCAHCSQFALNIKHWLLSEALTKWNRYCNFCFQLFPNIVAIFFCWYLNDFLCLVRCS